MEAFTHDPLKDKYLEWVARILGMEYSNVESLYRLKVPSIVEARQHVKALAFYASAGSMGPAYLIERSD